MKKIKEFIKKIKTAWELTGRIEIMKNYTTGVEEVWMRMKDQTGRKDFQCLYRVR